MSDLRSAVRVTFPDGTSEVIRDVRSVGTDNHGVLTLYRDAPMTTQTPFVVKRYALANVRSWAEA